LSCQSVAVAGALRRGVRAGALLPVLAWSVAAAALGAEETGQLLRTDSRAPYVHRISLYDHDGRIIDPRDSFAGPYSPKMTCGKCHDYRLISGGWHFSEQRRGLPGGRAGEPWVLIDAKTGGQTLLSGRGWPGTARPDEAGLTDWQFLRRFGGYTPGGGFGEPAAEVVAASRERARWEISGPLEIDCMMCHAAGRQHDPAELARQIERENYKWAATVALGLAVLRGDAKDLPDDWDPLMPTDPNLPPVRGPELVWNVGLFDADDRVLFDIAPRPTNERCYFCHSVRVVGADAGAATTSSQDVHLAAGLSCVDCHQNALDHLIVRGYEGESAERVDPAVGAYSCRGCHMGVACAEDPWLRLGGHHGAPHPLHRGLPPIHLERLACTACHSGPWPAATPARFQTARAHGLGRAVSDRAADDLPAVVGPIFLRQPDGKITPERLVAGGDGHYGWPMAHDVRPAAQALGALGCEDCHARTGVIYFGGTVASGVDSALQPWADAGLMCALRGDDGLLTRAWALGFAVRPVFKLAALVCAVVVAAVVLQVLLVARSRACEKGGARNCGRRWAETAALVLLLLGLAVSALTGFGGAWVGAGVSGWLLLAHMAGAPLFAVGLGVLALLWGGRRRFGWQGTGVLNMSDALSKGLLGVTMVLGLVTIGSMLVAMWPVFGYQGQAVLVEVHLYSALGLTVAAGLWLVRVWRARAVRGG